MKAGASFSEFARLVKFCREQKLLQAKFGGMEVTLHPSGFIHNEEPPPKPKKDGEEEPLPLIDSKKLRLRDLEQEEAEEQINGEKVDDKIQYAHVEGDGDVFGR